MHLDAIARHGDDAADRQRAVVGRGEEHDVAALAACRRPGRRAAGRPCGCPGAMSSDDWPREVDREQREAHRHQSHHQDDHSRAAPIGSDESYPIAAASARAPAAGSLRPRTAPMQATRAPTATAARARAASTPPSANTGTGRAGAHRRGERGDADGRRPCPPSATPARRRRSRRRRAPPGAPPRASGSRRRRSRSPTSARASATRQPARRQVHAVGAGGQRDVDAIVDARALRARSRAAPAPRRRARHRRAPWRAAARPPSPRGSVAQRRCHRARRRGRRNRR